MAFILLYSGLTHLFLPPVRGYESDREALPVMSKLIQELLILAMLVGVSAGVSAQRRDNDKRPPKEPVKVITNDRKDNRPPPQNSNRPPKDNKKKPN